MPALAMTILASNGPLDSIAGLPLHPLVVHLVVVVLPMAALLLVFVVVFKRWRRPFDLIALIGLVIGAAGAVLAKQSGQALVAYVGLPQDHANWGTILVYLAASLVVVAAVWVWLERRDTDPRRTVITRIAGTASVLLALTTVVMTALVGHTGAASVWGDAFAQSGAVAVPAASAFAAPSEVSGVTMAEISRHSTPDDCWTAVNANAYDLTSWIVAHPGGAEVIIAMCGTDATAAFAAQHGGQGKPERELKRLLIGPVVGE